MNPCIVTTLHQDGIVQDVERVQEELHRVSDPGSALLKTLEARTGTPELINNFKTLELIIICPRIISGEGIEEVLGAYYPLGLPQALFEFVPDEITTDGKRPVIALFKDSIDQALPSRNSTEALWRHVFLHEIGHATLTVPLKDYQTSTGCRYAEGLANWFAWSTSRESDRFVFDEILQKQSDEYWMYREILDAGRRLAPLMGGEDKIIGLLRNVKTPLPTFDLNDANKKLIDDAQSMLPSLGSFKSGLETERSKWAAYRAKQMLHDMAKKFGAQKE